MAKSTNTRGFKQGLYVLTLLFSDVAAYYMALVLAYVVRVALSFLRPLDFTLGNFVEQFWMLGLMLFLFMANSLYNRRPPLWMESGRILKALVVSFIIVLSVVTLGHLYDKVSRLFLCLFWLFLPATVYSLRIFAKKLILNRSFFHLNTLVIGDAKRMPGISKAFGRDSYMGLAISAEKAISENTSEAEVTEWLNEYKPNCVIIVAPHEENAKLMPIMSYVHTHVSRIYYVPSSASLDLTNAETGQLLSSQTGYMYMKNAMQSVLNRAAKRVSDLVLAVILLPVVLPIIGVLSIAIRIGSPGAGIFRHERMGRDGKPFKVYKLRTMYKDADLRLKELLKDPEIKAEWEQFYKLKDDPRITPLGKFLRKSSLDELPQYFNVIKGEMSFVGPRPVLKDEIDKYYGKKAVYYYMSTPGITGLWQVNGRNDLSYDDRVDMDAWYVYNWSPWMDIVILLSTPLAVLLRKGAY
jgi:undecaprenyl-phosphate galactose phosphotransferase